MGSGFRKKREPIFFSERALGNASPVFRRGLPEKASPPYQRASPKKGLSEERALGKRASEKGSPHCSVLALTLSCTYRCPLAGAFGKACPFCQGLSELGCPSRSRAFGKRTPFLSGAHENARPFLFRGGFLGKAFLLKKDQRPMSFTPLKKFYTDECAVSEHALKLHRILI
jgi:hypothetical protein